MLRLLFTVQRKNNVIHGLAEIEKLHTNMKQGIKSCFTNNAIHHLRDHYSRKVSGLTCAFEFFPFSIRPLLT